MPLAKEKSRCYNVDKGKNIFNLLFIFLSLSFRGHPGIVWSTIPGLSICGESPLTMRAQVFCDSLLPLGTARYRYRDAPAGITCTVRI